MSAKQARAAYNAISRMVTAMFAREHRAALLATIILRNHRPDVMPQDHGNPDVAKCIGHFNAIEEEITWPCHEYEALLSALDNGWQIHNDAIEKASKE